MKRVISILIVTCALVITGCVSRTTPVGPTDIELELEAGVSVPIRIWSVSSRPRILWISSDHGFPAGMQSLAGQLQLNGYEVWQADILAADFLPQLPSSLEKVSDRYLLLLLEKALQHDNRELVLMADGLGAKLLMRMAQAWRHQHGGQWPKQVVATVLISPVLYRATPAVGTEAQYINSAGATGGKQFVFQPMRSPYYWWLQRTISRLKQRSNEVSVNVLQGVRDRFYFRPDANRNEQGLAAQFGKQIADQLKQ